MDSSSQTRADIGCSICTSASKHQKKKRKAETVKQKKNYLTILNHPF